MVERFGGDAYSTVAVTDGLQSKTCQVESKHLHFPDNLEICIVDTPGLDDTSMSDAEVFLEIADWLRTSCVSSASHSLRD